MSRRFKVWLNSGANIHSCRKVEVALDEIGVSDGDFDEMSDEEKDEMFREVAFQASDWGWEEIE